MYLLDRLIGALTPYDCLGCGVEGGLLCSACARLFPDLPERCYRCLRPSSGGATCSGCRPTSHLHAVRAATGYEGIARDVVWRLKFSGARSATLPMAQCMLPLLMQMSAAGLTAGLTSSDVPSADPLIVPVSTATSRVRQRGYDHAKLLARELALSAGLPYAACLARSGQAHQVGTSREDRLRQLHGAFRITKPRLVSGASIILVDDVVTTGATLEAAAQVLRQCGARQVDALVFAQTEL